MQKVTFGEMAGEIQDSRHKVLGKFFGQHKEKKVKKKKEKQERKKKEKEVIVKSNGDLKIIKDIRRVEKKDYILERQMAFRLRQSELDMLQLILNSEEAKDCGIKPSYFFRKAIHIFFFEFCNNKELFCDKLIRAAEFEEKDDPVEAKEIEELIEREKHRESENDI